MSLSLIIICYSWFSRPVSDIEKIYNIIRELGQDRESVRITEINELCTNKGYNEDQVMACIDEYEELNVWQVNQTRTKVTFAN